MAAQKVAWKVYLWVALKVLVSAAYLDCLLVAKLVCWWVDVSDCQMVDWMAA